MNAYMIIKEKHQKEVNEFPMAFAFSNRQFEEGMKKLGLSLEDTDKVYKLGNTGGFYRREDAEKLHAMFDRHTDEMQAEIDKDMTGESFIFDMFDYELGNHEYVVTVDIEDTLDALDLTLNDVYSDKRLLHGLNKAIKHQRDCYKKNKI